MVRLQNSMGLMALVLYGLRILLGPPIEAISDPEEPFVFHPNQFFVEIDSLATIDALELSGLLSDLNSSEVWREDDLNLAIWEVKGYPFTVDGQDILDINGAITASRKKVKIRSATLNIQQAIIDNNVGTSESSCFNIADYQATQGIESIKISILDTGISDGIQYSGSTGYNYNLTSYTGYDYVHNDNIPEDEHGHGTHLAGIMHSITHQNIEAGISKITYDIRKTHDSNGQAFMSAVVMALIDAKNAHADIINMSFSVNDTYHDTLFYPLKNVINWLETEGILVIAAAGNDFGDNDNMSNTALPASFPSDNIISVTSTDCQRRLSSFANYGAHSVDIATLGEKIPGPDLNSGIVYLSGTSQAAAIVTAISALHASKQDEFDYKKTKCALISTSTHFVELGDVVYSDGILNPQEALQAIDATCPSINENCQKNFVNTEALTGSVSNNTIYETFHAIESNQSLQSTTHISYDALMSTTLIPGFEMPVGASLQISTDGCNN